MRTLVVKGSNLRKTHLLSTLYEGESNENLKFVIKNRNFAPLSYKLVSML